MSVKERLRLMEESERRNSRNIYPGLMEAERQRNVTTAAAKGTPRFSWLRPQLQQIRGLDARRSPRVAQHRLGG